VVAAPLEETAMRPYPSILAALVTSGLTLACAGPAAARTFFPPVQGPSSFGYYTTLTAGRDYALSNTSETGVHGTELVYYRPDDRTPPRLIASVPLCGQDDTWCGVTFRAPRTGPYELYLAVDSINPDLSPAIALDVSGDCGGDRTTRCRIAVGATKAGRMINYQGDADWFRAYLRHGRTYVFTATLDTSRPGALTPLSVVDDRGAQVAAGASSDLAPTVTVRPARDGCFYVRVVGNTGFPPVSYTLTAKKG
jgi:hypothetical protein